MLKTKKSEVETQGQDSGSGQTVKTQGQDSRSGHKEIFQEQKEERGRESKEFWDPNTEGDEQRAVKKLDVWI